MEKRAAYAVVGATGTVGREVLAALWDAEVPSEDLTLFGSERSAGDEVDYGDDSLEVEPVGPESFRGQSAVILAVPADVAKSLAPTAQAAGAWVVDVSAAHRLLPDVPLVVPAVNRASLERPFKGRIVATPGPVTAALVTALEPLREGFGARRAFVTALLAASSQGRAGISELEKQTAGLLSGRDEEPAAFPHRLAFNLIPQVGAFGGGAESGAESGEERSWPLESARVWAAVEDAPAISGTAIQVPTFFGHAFTAVVELGRDAAVAKVREALRRAPGLKVLDDAPERIYPMPMLVTADPTVHVGRIRAVAGAPRFVELFGVVDNAGRGAGWNAVELARALVKRP